MGFHIWRLCRHAWYRLPHSRPGQGWSMRWIVVPAPARHADLRACYFGDRFPITGCLCRSQLWCPLRGVTAKGAHPFGQVGAACAARHDVPHRTHHQRAWPDGSGRRVKCPRMPGDRSTVSRGNTIRPGWGAAAGPGLGSTFPHVARDPHPVDNRGIRGGSVVVVVGGRQARAPSVSCESPPGFANGDRSAGGPPPPVPRRPRTGCGGTACSATRATRSPFPTTSVASRPGFPLPG